MNITKITDYDIMTDVDNDSLSLNNNCTDNENNIDILYQHFYLQNHVIYHFYV